jgi:hypothetical protein
MITILIVFAVVSIVGTLVFRAYDLNRTDPDTAADDKVEIQGEARRTQVSATLTECNRNESNNRTRAKGYITNTGNVDLHYVTVKVLWLNGSGLLVETDDTYALNDEILTPGQSKSFTADTKNMTAVKCNVETIDWW